MVKTNNAPKLVFVISPFAAVGRRPCVAVTRNAMRGAERTDVVRER